MELRETGNYLILFPPCPFAFHQVALRLHMRGACECVSAKLSTKPAWYFPFTGRKSIRVFLAAEGKHSEHITLCYSVSAPHCLGSSSSRAAPSLIPSCTSERDTARSPAL